MSAVIGMALAQVLGTLASDKLSDSDRQNLTNAINDQIRADNEVIEKQRQFDQDTINMLQTKYDENTKFQKQQQDIQMNAVLTQLQLDQVKLKQAQMDAEAARKSPGVAGTGMDSNTMILLGAGALALILLIR